MRSWFLSLALFLVLPMVGCATGPWSRSVNSFSTTSAPALDKVTAAYTTTTGVHALEQQAHLLAHYDTDGFHPGTITPFLPADELKARTSAITGLREYVTLLGQLTSAAKTTPTSLAKSTTSSASSGSSSTSKTMNQQQLTQLLKGLDAVVQPYLNHKVHQNLPPMIKAADPSVQAICTLLTADLGDLRQQTTSDYRVVLMEQAQFIATNKQRMSAVEERTEVEKLTQIELDAQKADSDNEAAQAATKQLADAHHRLATGGKK